MVFFRSLVFGFIDRSGLFTPKKMLPAPSYCVCLTRYEVSYLQIWVLFSCTFLQTSHNLSIANVKGTSHDSNKIQNLSASEDISKERSFNESNVDHYLEFWTVCFHPVLFNLLDWQVVGVHQSGGHCRLGVPVCVVLGLAPRTQCRLENPP